MKPRAKPAGIEGLAAHKIGRGFKLENGGAVAIFDATPPGFYWVQIKLVPEGEIQFFLSNQGAAALLVLLYEDYTAGKLTEGLEKLPGKDKEAGDGREGKKEVRDE